MMELLFLAILIGEIIVFQKFILPTPEQLERRIQNKLITDPDRERVVSEVDFDLITNVKNFWLMSIFTTIPVLILLFYFGFRELQSIIIPSGSVYVTVSSFVVFILPIGLFGLASGGLILDPFLGKGAFIRKFGREKGEAYYQAATNMSARQDKITKVVLLMLCFLFFVPISLSVDHYFVVTPDKIYVNPWSSLGEEKTYAWSDLKRIYIVEGKVLADGKYDPGTDTNVEFEDGSEAWFHETNDYQTTAYLPTPIGKYLSNKTGLAVECKRYDVRTKNYVGCGGTARKAGAKTAGNNATGAPAHNAVTPDLNLSLVHTYSQTIRTASGSYELYLPDNYSSEKAYPLLICLSPGGNGADFYEPVYPVSRRLGFILACSNDFSNDIPLNEYLPKIKDTIYDVKKRFNITVMYIGGFSGGGMGSYVISYFEHIFDGIITNSGAIHQKLYDSNELRKMQVRKVALICGKGDTVVSCEYMKNDEQWLKSAGFETYLLEFDGGHELAPQETYETALNWLKEQ